MITSTSPIRVRWGSSHLASSPILMSLNNIETHQDPDSYQHDRLSLSPALSLGDL